MLAIVGILLAALGSWAPAVEAQGAASQVTVPLPAIGIGFVRHAFGAWTTRIADGGFTTATGRNLRWFPHDTDSSLAAALASGKLDIAIMGASVAASTAARGLDLRIFYVLGASGGSDGLVLSTARGVPGTQPNTLKGMVIAVPFGSSSHFRLLESLKRWSIGVNSMRIVNLQTTQIADAWRRGEIDGAAVSQPLLGLLSAQGRLMPLPETSPHAGLVVAVANTDFAARHLVFLSRFVDVVARADVAAHALAVGRDKDAADVLSISFITGLPAQTVVDGISRYRPPSLESQASPTWLGGGAQSGLAAELRGIIDVWRSGGRLAGNEPDYAALISVDPVQLALTYR